MCNAPAVGLLTRVFAAVLAAASLVHAADVAEAESQASIPVEIVASARQYAISRVGETFFDSYMTWLPALSRFRPLDPRNLGKRNLPDWRRASRYEMRYKVSIPDKPYVEAIVSINITEDARWFRDRDPRDGLPDCISTPGECEFPIDMEAAIRIAEDAGLRPGLNESKAYFRWRGGAYDTYVWFVTSTLYERGGDYMFIDANSGDVIYVGEWRTG